MKKKLLFVSSRALYPPYLKVIQILSDDYNLDCSVIASEFVDDSPVWQTSVKLNKEDYKKRINEFSIYFLTSVKQNFIKYGIVKNELKETLETISPDYIFILDEFWEGITSQFLQLYKLRKKPLIISYIAISHSSNSSLLKREFPFVSRTRSKQILLWGRLNGIVACAKKSAQCARRLKLPSKIPVLVNYLPVFGPEDVEVELINLPWNKDDDFIIGFAGLLSEQKGWKYLVEAILKLPENYKLAIAGDGEQKNELLNIISEKNLESRIHFAGLLSKEKLFNFYKKLNLFVLPSITTTYSVEQMGAVLAEAMASKIPVIGSDSGAIPETVGDAGLIFQEKNVDDLVDKIKLIAKDDKLRNSLISNGLNLFKLRYSCEAYASTVYDFLNTLENPDLISIRSKEETVEGL